MKDKKYKFRIEPLNGKLRAEIYKEVETAFSFGKLCEIRLMHKDFKRWLMPIETSDYRRAKDWVKYHIDNLNHFNKLL